MDAVVTGDEVECGKPALEPRAWMSLASLEPWSDLALKGLTSSSRLREDLAKIAAGVSCQAPRRYCGLFTAHERFSP